MSKPLTVFPSPRDVQRWAFDAEISTAELYRRAGLHPSTFNRWRASGSTKTETLQRLWTTFQQIMESKNAEGQTAERAENGGRGERGARAAEAGNGATEQRAEC